MLLALQNLINLRASGPRHLTLSAAAGSYSISGVASSLKFSRTLQASAGSYSVSGVSSALRRGYASTAGAGAYSINGVAATLTFTGFGPTAYLLTANTGTYAITGGYANLSYTDNSKPTKVGGDDAPRGQRYQVQVKNKVHLFDTDEEAIAFLNSLKKKVQKKAVVTKVDPAYEKMMAEIMDELDDEEALLMLI